jgi:hypothetical protein
MRNFSIISVFLVGLLASVLQRSNKEDLPAEQNLSSFPQTQFLPTLEDKIDPNKNAIYAATKSLAWDELKMFFGDSIFVNPKDTDLALLNSSVLHRNALSKTDYNSIVAVDSGTIRITTSMFEQFQFETTFEKFSRKLNFNGKFVECFGEEPTHESDIRLDIGVIYFDDDNFLLIPRLKGNRTLFLLKTEKRFERPVDMLDELKKYFAQSRVFRDNMSTYWRTVYLGEDQIIIPKIRFNIETNYPQFENKSFVVNHANYIIAQSYQRIAFNMDEKGVTFESVVKLEIFGTNDVEEEKTVPKKLIFDKPFYIILRKNNATVPYFIAYIQNPELMILE